MSAMLAPHRPHRPRLVEIQAYKVAGNKLSVRCHRCVTLEQRNYARCTCARSRACACCPCCGCHSCRRRSTTTNLPVRSCMRFSLLSFVELRRPLPLPFRPRALNLQVDSPVTSLLGRCSYGHIVALALEHPTLIYASSPPHHFLPSFFCTSSLPRSPPQPSLIPLPVLRLQLTSTNTYHKIFFTSLLPFSSGSLMRQPLTISLLPKSPTPPQTDRYSHSPVWPSNPPHPRVSHCLRSISPLSFISCPHCTHNHPRIPPPPSIVIWRSLSRDLVHFDRMAKPTQELTGNEFINHH